MTGAAPTVVVPERGTRLRRSAVIADPRGGFVWLRRAGDRAPTGLSSLPEHTVAAVDGVRTPTGSRWSTGTPAGAWSGFPMPAAHSVWEELVTGAIAPGDPAVASALAESGRLLRGLHDIAPPTGDRPASLARLERWIAAEGTGPAAADQARQLLSDALGPTGWYLLGAWTQALGRPSALVHGWFGLGHVARDHGTVRATVGDDAGPGDPALDVGFLLGQLDELEAFGSPRPDPAVIARLRAALAEGYGDLPAGVDRAVAVQLALHVHDFAHYFVVVEAELPTWVGLVAAAVERAR